MIVVFSVTSLATAASSVTDYGAGSPVGPLAKVALSQLSVKGRAPMTGYSRDMFGSAWQDLDGNVHEADIDGMLATVLQLVDNDSFNVDINVLHEELMARLSYFAFVTIASLGYGDVVPASPVGEVFAVFVSISSTLYISLLIGLLLSRFIASQSLRGESAVRVEDQP